MMLSAIVHRRSLAGASLVVVVGSMVCMLASCSMLSLGKREHAMAAMGTVPHVPREFRGVWVATVANIDWPRNEHLSSKQQQAELVRLLDRAKADHQNAVILQVRPSADALYDSKIEPWSEYLTGKQGRPPKPYYDPLRFAIQAAHKRGLQLHAWFNPFRVRAKGARSPMAAKSVFRQHPSWVKHYGSLLWLDPGVPAARRYVIHVIMDVVHRYDVDGIHLDDYFYPYPKRDKQGKVIPFPDGASWRAYLAQGGTLDRAAWRRSNIDKFVQRLYAAVKYTKPQVLVGISPFGIWKPGHPPQIHGFNQMSQIYANPRLWLRRGWVDYLTPQLYWPIARPQQSYTALLRWWQQQNVRGRHLWPGLAAWRAVKDTGTFTPKEIQYQVEWTRIIERKDPGEVMFSAQAFRHANSPLAKRLRATVYRRAALVPASPWLSNGRPRPCAVRVSAVKGDTVTVQVKHATVPKDGWWVVQMRSGGQWSYRIAGAAQRSMKLALHGKQMQVQRLVAFAVNRLGVASRKVAVRHVR